MCPALVCKFPVATEYGSIEQLEVLYEVRTREVQQLVHRIEQVKEQAAQEQDELHQQLVLVNAKKEYAVLQNTQSMKNLSK
jgi:di/tripeptidase